MIPTCNSGKSICLGSLAIRPFRVLRGTVAGRAETLQTTATMNTKLGIKGFQTVPISKRFFEKVNKDGPIPAHVQKLGKCWLWLGAKSGKYGTIWMNGSQIKTHRISFILQNGPIPENKIVMHKCDNHLCVNPEHLEIGTQSLNLLDCVKKGRHKSKFLRKHQPPQQALSTNQSKP